MKKGWKYIACLMMLDIIIFFGVLYVSKADDIIVRGGPAIVEGVPSGAAKYFGVRREHSIQRSNIAASAELGGWVGRGLGRTSAVARLQLGVTPGPYVGVFGKAFVGPCFITRTDALLGGHAQFCTDIGVGVRDEYTLMSIGYSHISSAGMSSPNKGRDWLTFEIGLRL